MLDASNVARTRSFAAAFSLNFFLLSFILPTLSPPNLRRLNTQEQGNTHDSEGLVLRHVS